MIRQHGRWSKYFGAKNESVVTASKPLIHLHKPLEATAVTKFDRSGYLACHIMSVSGHKSESCLKSYCKTGQNTKEKMADTLMSITDEPHSSTQNTSLLPVPSEVTEPPLLLTDSQEEFITRDLTLHACQTTNTPNGKQFNLHTIAR